MNSLTIASSEADARAAEAVEQHHAQMSGALAAKAEAVAAVARSGGGEQDLAPLRDDLVAWAREELVPHARAEEDTLYRAAAERDEGRLLVAAMLADHEAMAALVDELAGADDPVTAAVAAGALRTAFAMHLAKENEQVLPLLVADPDVSVAVLLDGMHELLGHGHPDEPTPRPSPDRDHEAASCGCGEVDPPSWPTLDARAVPHAIRHATICGALDAVAPGRGLVLVAPHDPLPLLAQLEQRSPGAFAIDYIDRGPEVWRLAIARRSA